MPLAMSVLGWSGLGFLYLVLMASLGLACIRKGHWVMFLVGIFLPVFWLIGALMPRVQATT